MADGLIVSPEAERLKEAIAQARRQLAAVLEEIERATRIEGPWIVARYDAVFGLLEVELLRERAAIAALRREIERIAMFTNRGVVPTPAEVATIQAEVRRELSAWWEEIHQREADVFWHVAVVRDAEPGLPEDRARRVKSLFRELVRALHPDAVGHMSEAFTRYWDEVLSAYEAGDLDRLEALSAVVRAGRPVDVAPESLADELRRLEGLVERHLAVLVRMRGEPPLSLAPLLADPARVQARKDEIARERTQVERTRAELVALRDALLGHRTPALPGGGTLH